MSQVITFYSYKGGVGRTMALANVSILLAKWGHKVLVVDWDLEAPGLEHFYKDYLENNNFGGIKIVESIPGVIDLLQIETPTKWQDAIISVQTGSETPIHLISSGRRDEGYFKKVREFDVTKFYEEDGGELIEQLRNEWLDNYDYVFIDSRTGITEIGGICTIQLPDIVVMLFTATDQGFEGALDIIKRAGAAQQRLPYDRQKLIFLPIPSKFDSNTEFKLSQVWLGKFVTSLGDVYNDWLPASVDRKEFLELTKIPYVPYFSFGEKLPVIEQGVRDPSGLGYAYENLALLVGNSLNNTDWLFNDRLDYIKLIDKNYDLDLEKTSQNSNNLNQKLLFLRQKLNVHEGGVKIEKNRLVLLECLKKSIIPLLEMLSLRMQEITVFFKNKNEEIYVSTEHTENEFGVEKVQSGNFSLKLNSDNNVNILRIENIVNDVEFQYETKKNNEVNRINYHCSFSKLRNVKNNNWELYTSINIEFHDLLYDIKAEGVNTIERKYGMQLSSIELDEITKFLFDALLQKIDLKRKEFS